jgi:hypothetical protein
MTTCFYSDRRVAMCSAEYLGRPTAMGLGLRRRSSFANRNTGGDGAEITHSCRQALQRRSSESVSGSGRTACGVPANASQFGQAMGKRQSRAFISSSVLESRISAKFGLNCKLSHYGIVAGLLLQEIRRCRFPRFVLLLRAEESAVSVRGLT